MAKEFLWAGRDSNLEYVGNDGNVEVLTGQKGTVMAWVNTPWAGNSPAEPSTYYSKLVQFHADNNNYIALQTYRSGGGFLRLTSVVGGVAKTCSYTLDATIWPANTWHFVCATWDFTGGVGAGVLRLYLNGVEVSTTACTDASPLGAAPAKLYVGAACGASPTGTGWKGFIDNVAIFDGVCTVPQMAALYSAGRRKPIVEADGTGNLR